VRLYRSMSRTRTITVKAEGQLARELFGPTAERLTRLGAVDAPQTNPLGV
jgi:hypothetical protein